MSREAVNVTSSSLLLLLLLLLLSLLGRSYSILSRDLLLQFLMDLSVEDSIRLFWLGTGMEGGLWAVVSVAYHGGLGRMGTKSAMVVVVGCFEKQEVT